MNIHNEIKKLFHLSNTSLKNLPHCAGMRFNRNHLCILFNNIGFKVGAEIGVRRGRFSESLCKHIDGLKLYCIDPWAVIGTKYSEEKQEAFFQYTRNRLTPYNVTYIRKTSNAALADIDDNELNFVFIDGDHDFDFVMVDIINWSHKVKKGGIVAVHDFYTGEVGIVQAVEAYIRSHDIRPWYATKELEPTAFWVKP